MLAQSSWGGLLDDVEFEDELFVSLNIFHSLFPGESQGLVIETRRLRSKQVSEKNKQVTEKVRNIV